MKTKCCNDQRITKGKGKDKYGVYEKVVCAKCGKLVGQKYRNLLGEIFGI